MIYCVACAKNYAWPRGPEQKKEKARCNLCGRESLCIVPKTSKAAPAAPTAAPATPKAAEAKKGTVKTYEVKK